MKKKYSLIILILSLMISIIACSNTNAVTTISKEELRLQIEGDNFIFYSLDNDTRYIQVVAEALQDSYLPLTEKMRVDLNEKIEVFLYPNEESLKKAVSRDYKTMLGYAGEKEIHLVSILSLNRGYTNKDFKALAVHEFVHILAGEINSVGVPLWLNEGLATYEAQQMNREWTRIIKQRVSNGTIPSLDDLKWNLYDEKGGYGFSYTIVEYIKEEYGYDKLIELISSPFNFKTVLGVYKEDFEENWKSFLKESYK